MPTLQLVKVNIPMPVVKLRFRGADHHFIVDTGAQGTMVDPDAIGVNQNTTLRPLGIGGVGGDQMSALAEVRFNFCGVTINEMGLMLTLRQASLAYGVKLSGLIGQDILGQFRQVIFDNDKHTVEFVPR
jgi:hypothetical protein